MALADTIVAAMAGLAGAGLGAWATTRSTWVNARRGDVIAAHAELATVHELIFTNDSVERSTRKAALRYRLARLGVSADLTQALLQALEVCNRELSAGRRAAREGAIRPDEVGLDTALVERALAAADGIARALNV